MDDVCVWITGQVDGLRFGYNLVIVIGFPDHQLGEGRVLFCFTIEQNFLVDVLCVTEVVIHCWGSGCSIFFLIGDDGGDVLRGGRGVAFGYIDAV